MEYLAEVKGDTTKINTFKVQALGVTGLRSFAGMVTGATTLKLFSYMMEWRDPFLAKTINGKTIVFVGNWTMHHNPMVVAFAPQKPWQWPKFKATFSTVDMEGLYLYVANRGKLWSTAERGVNVEKILPRVVSLPHVVMPWICEQDCRPNKLRCWIE